MSLVLKADWKGKGRKAQMVADWMNIISNQFNRATVPSGGTAQPTPTGFQIEVDTGAPYHFEVIPYPTGEGIEIEVRGGWWTYYEAEVPTQVNLAVAGTSYDDTTGALTTVTGAGVVYLELDTDADTLTAKFATDAAWAAVVDTVDIFRKLVAEITWDASNSIIGEIRQDWRGGNIKSILSAAAENDHSFHYRGGGRMTVGGYRHGDNLNVVIPTATASNYRTLSPVVSQAYWVKVDWSASLDGNVAPVISWEQGAVFPSTSDDDIWIYQVLEFDGAGVPIERRQGDINISDIRIPTPTGSNPGTPTYDGNNIVWQYAEQEYTYLGREAGGDLDFDRTRWNGGTP